MKLSYTTTNEVLLRRRLARYFRRVPPLSAQSPAARRRTRRALGTLLRLELHDVSAFAGHDRPLFYGDLTLLLRALGNASALLLKRQNDVTLTAELPENPLRAAYEPRLLPLAVTLLLRSACRRGQSVLLRLEVRAHKPCIVVSAAAVRLPDARRDALCEIARLHGGRLFLSEKEAVLSLSFATEKAVGEAPSPTADTLLRNLLSPVYLGLYASPSNE